MSHPEGWLISFKLLNIFSHFFYAAEYIFNF
jgi:hypothetical protein